MIVKKILSICLFVVCAITMYAQSRLGYSVSEIRQEFSESKYNLKSNYDKNNNFYISISTETSSVVYYFNSNDKCIITFIVPDNQGSLNAYVESYNKQYVIVSPTQWKMYCSEGIAEIKLVYGDDGGYYFIWNNQKL